MSATSRSRVNTFAGLALDRAGERRDEADWIAARLAASDTRFLLVNPEGEALLDATQDALRLLDERERVRLLPETAPSLLGIGAAGAVFLLAAPHDIAVRAANAANGRFLDLRSAGTRLPMFEAGLFAYARGLAHWQAHTRWCGACGTRLELAAAGHRGHCPNPDCSLDHFPRTDPAIIVIVTCGDACLLGRQPGWRPRGYSTLAGFVEPGETLEDAVRREVLEEAGVHVIDCDYHSSQPWPFPSSLMLGFTARAEDRAIRMGPELADARWFTAADIVRGLAAGELLLSPPLSVSYRLIEHWLRENAGLELAALVRDESGVVAARPG